MLKKFNPPSSFIITLVFSTITHILILFFLKSNALLNPYTSHLNEKQFLKKFQLDDIKILSPEELKQFRQVGIKGGKKNILNPDIKNSPKPPLQSDMRPKNQKNLDFEKLGLDKNFANQEVRKPTDPVSKSIANLNQPKLNTLDTKNDLYFNFKKQRIIPPSREHNEIKKETIQNLGVQNLNTKAQNISNFDIRVERPEGISEDQLNSDEKAFYSFYKRTYSNYVSKLYSTYDEVRVGHPGIDKDFEEKHLLIGKIDYDENGNIVTIKILKSSNSDDIHYFFEEALKKLVIPNPPKIFTKNKKGFSIYYQIHIN
jgi:hypothetical protein